MSSRFLLPQQLDLFRDDVHPEAQVLIKGRPRGDWLTLLTGTHSHGGALWMYLQSTVQYSLLTLFPLSHASQVTPHHRKV